MWDVGVWGGGVASVDEAVTYLTAMGAAMIFLSWEGYRQARPPTGSTTGSGGVAVVGEWRNHVSRETWFRGVG